MRSSLVEYIHNNNKIHLQFINRTQTKWPVIDFLVLMYLRNTKKIIGFLGKEINPDLIPHHINFSNVSPEDYQQMTNIIRGVMENDYPRLGLDNCDIKEELNKVRRSLKWTDTPQGNLRDNCYTQTFHGIQPGSYTLSLVLWFVRLIQHKRALSIKMCVFFTHNP